MVTPKPMHRLLLRAELCHGSSKFVTHTMEISESLVFVQTEETAYIGDKVQVRFSFPGLIEPFSVETQVVAKQLAAGPGRLGGWTLGFVFYSETERARLRELLAQFDEPEPAPVPEVTVGPPTYRVLLVEDNDMTREAFALAVARFFGHPDSGISVDIVASGQEAWQRLRDDHYDLAIVDYFLPAFNGDRLIARLRREPGLTELPVVAISVGGPEAKQASLDAGADLFLHKPIVLRDLFATLSHLTSARSGRTRAQA
ncbi:response regulator [Haliangium sp.]|uniref:response regulator n=1 Tax=Haliangium sp. TaxID=2663208 RepID=UPI003D0B13E8